MTSRTLADAQVRRTLICLRACEPYDTASLEAGALERVIAAGLAMTAAAELIFSWSSQGGMMPQRIKARLDGACREFLEARGELVQSHETQNGGTK